VASGALAGSSPWVYKRHDGATAVLYIDIFQHVHEITVADGNVDLINTFQLNAPNAAAAPTGGPAPDVIGYIRTDQKSAIVYRSVDDHVIELLSNFGGQPRWLVTDLTAAAGTSVTIAKGSPFPFVRTDGWNSIPYVASDNHIHELATTGNGAWGDWDITLQTGDPVVPSTDPWAFVRSDSWNVIVFVGADGTMRQFGLFAGDSHWNSWTLPAVSPLTGLYQRPSGYIAADGINAIVYTGIDQKIHQLKMGSQGWLDSVLPTGCVKPASQLFAHPGPRTRSSVLFQGRESVQGSNRRYALTQPLGGPWTLQEF